MIRDLNAREIENLKLLNNYSTKSATIILTDTGLKKSIMDATYEVRLFLKSNHLHDFEKQNKGPDNKVIKNAFFYFEGEMKAISASLYRPVTKDGDPRIWFCGIKEFINHSCALHLIYHNQSIYVFEITSSKLVKELQNPNFIKILEEIRNQEEEVALELFHKIKAIFQKGWVASTGSGDTAVGKTLEDLLGIKINSSKMPDYKGIEIKAYRKGAKFKRTRSNLFAQVADWNLSIKKSSREMLETFGYFRNGKNRLNCTVSSKVKNSQGLQFEIDFHKEYLKEIYIDHKNNKTECLIWSFELLLNRLKEKHAETFWVEADYRINENGKEEFLYKKITHTKNPIITQLIPLLDQGIITMDHLISDKGKNSVVEKGPLFKIDLKNLSLLFPEPNELELNEES